jgi:hypothetical protein
MRSPSGSTTQPIGNTATLAAQSSNLEHAIATLQGRRPRVHRAFVLQYRTARSPKMYGVIPSSYSLQCGQWLHRHPPVLIPNSQDLISVAVNHQAILTSVNLFGDKATCFRCVFCSMRRCISGTALSCSFQTDDKC